MKTSFLKKKALKLLARVSNPEIFSKLNKIFKTGERSNLKLAIKEANRTQLKQALKLLEEYAGEAQTTPQSYIKIEEWWDEKLIRIKLQIFTQWPLDSSRDKALRLLGKARELTRADKLGYGEGQVRPDVNLGRWDLYAILYALLHQEICFAWDSVVGLIASIQEDEFRVQEEMNGYDVDTLEQLRIAKELEPLLNFLGPEEADLAAKLFSLKIRQAQEGWGYNRFVREFEKQFPDPIKIYFLLQILKLKNPS